MGRGHARHAVTVRGLPREAPRWLGPPLWAADSAAIFLPRSPPDLGPRAPASPRAPAARAPRSVSDG